MLLEIFISLVSYGSITANNEDCGLRYALNRFQPVISHGVKTLRSEFPWHVALYKQYSTDKSGKYICGGSILHSKVILTAAHCVYNDTYSEVENATFTVIAGKYHVSWNHIDPGEQRFKVIQIVVAPKYIGYKNRFAEDIALLELNKAINFSSAIMPVCIDWNPEYPIEQLSTFGTVVGWGRTEKNNTSDVLLMANLKYIEFRQCRDKSSSGFTFFITSDKFCAGLDNGPAVEPGDSGGGLTFPRNTTDDKEHYYLYGIVSIKDTDRSNIAAFTDLRKHLSWLNITLLKITDPGLFEVGCSPFPSSSVSLVECSLNGTSADCNRNAKLGTTAKLHCKSSYHSGSPFKLYTETKCSAGMQWLPLPESCIDCGKKYRFNRIIPLVKYKVRTFSDYPWHLALYRKDDETGMRLICGATIIHPKVVLTAAHCVHDESLQNVAEPTKHFIAAGKFKSSWNEKEPYEQKMQVKKIYLKNTYQGRKNFYKDDLAILELNKTINLSDYIMPTCMDWGGNLDLFRNPLVLGTSPGWGLTEEDKISNELRASKLRYADRLECMKLVSNDRLITPDKFCGVSVEGSVPDQGDSGGALTYPHYNGELGEELNYLYGIVSTKASDDVIALTNVTYHLNWIKTILLSIINDGGS